PATTTLHSLSLHDALPISLERCDRAHLLLVEVEVEDLEVGADALGCYGLRDHDVCGLEVPADHDLGRRARMRLGDPLDQRVVELDRKSTRLNSSHRTISYA